MICDKNKTSRLVLRNTGVQLSCSLLREGGKEGRERKGEERRGREKGEREGGEKGGDYTRKERR